MTGILDIIAASYERQPMTEVPVPEWGISLFFRALTPADRAKIRRGINPKDEELLFVSTLIHKALDKDGKPVFSDDATTRATLLSKADMTLLTRILQAASGTPVTADEAGNA